MIKVRGIYEEQHVRLLEPVVLAPDTPVEVLIPEGGIEQRQEQAFLRKAGGKGTAGAEWLMSSSREEEEPFNPVLPFREHLFLRPLLKRGADGTPSYLTL